MKKTLIRALVLFLAVAMLVPFVLTGCNGGSDATETKETTTSSSDDSKSTISAMFPYIDTDLKEMDFSAVNNGEFTILYQGPDNDLYSHEIYIEDGATNGNKIDGKIYERNAAAQKFFNIKFNFEPAAAESHSVAVIEKVNQAVGSGDNAYQLVIASHGGAYTPNAMEGGSFLNLKNIPNLDLNKGYWAKYVNDNAEVSGAIFGVTGSISLNLYQELYVCFFNSKLCRKNGIEPDSLYETVQDGKWTLDYLINLTKDIYEDKNGNGADDQDEYGYGFVLATMDTMWSACDISVTSRNSKGGLTLNVQTSKLVDVVSKLNDFAWNQNGVLCIDNEEDTPYKVENKTVYIGQGADLVATEHVLFANDRLYNVTLKSMKDSNDYGILPYPKYKTREQQQYYTGARDHYTVHMVPITAKNMADECGAVLEYLAYYSHNNVMPVYYEEVLCGRYTRDTNSIEMLNIIFQNVKMDSGYIFGVMTLELMRALIKVNSNQIDSAYQQRRIGAVSTCTRITNNYAKYVSNDNR